MIDTITLGVPLTEYQFARIQKQIKQNDQWQWVQYQHNTGNVRFLRVKGLAHLDLKSFHRQIAWDIPDQYLLSGTFLRIEFSIPKFWYGHNIHLLYNYIDALKELKSQLEKQLHCKFVPVLGWSVFRVDICYSWKCPTQRISQQVLDSLKHLHYPRKRPDIRDTGIMFPGTTYSFKFYLKKPEFIEHDRKVLLKSKASLDWINYLENLADGVLRCEATLRRKFLKKQSIELVADLLKASLFFTVTFKSPEKMIEYRNLTRSQLESNISKYASHLDLSNIDSISSYLGKLILSTDTEERHFSEAKAIQFEVEKNFENIILTYQYKNTLISTIQYFLTKFIGEHKGMDTAEQVKAKLLGKYKSAKAARLLGFWLHTQRFGSSETKDLYGKDIFYRSKADLKLADVSLVEPPKVIDASSRFIDSFRVEIPSPYVTNTVDDFRDSSNLLNLLTNSENDSKS